MKKLLFTLLLLVAVQLSAQTMVKVERVIDGDTFVIEGGERVRMLRIDTPERGEDGYEEAKQYMKARIEGKTITIIRKGKGYYRRTLGEVYMGDVNINDELLENGLAELYRKK